ncbi:uncharacterized protein B0I36DRAFT_379315 [Microdochium trichocladiopsis]|uniref:Arrestin C-terminal-like domain-containing protein n=1 Tax=Microdochium trichocladiopsis TaxID=1682393 RepID=A0A9P9BVI8_9PEZI|nr:uncharacterized protein B0I36DRAFT_379315 [Microdochium trichocladiopsis]KAH7040318.1 hypothetical protein B0I36DRAFT_379315 [Microdochium trichocladiopsis]
MPSFNPFTSVAGRNACTLFEIRLENDFIVLRGNEHEATSQILKGQVVLCLREPLKVEDIHLRLTGNCRVAWVDGKQTPTGIHTQKVDRTTTILRHSWPPFVSDPTNHHHHQTLAPGNYEWPFEYILPGDTSESIEGLTQTGISYALKATISRGKLAKNVHAYKPLRIIRTLEPAALEFNHAMSVENIWPNKIEYSVNIPQKAVVFGSNVPIEMRFTPLLKGLEMGLITAKLVEVQEFSISNVVSGATSKTHKHERDIRTWTIEVTREEHWQDNVEETGQEGWAVKKEWPLPRKLTQCLQDCTAHGIKIRHKIKLTVALKNPDGHVSELRATLPVTVFISPNMPLDEQGNLLSQEPSAEATNDSSDPARLAPPGYGQHVLDQLYEDVDPNGIITPPALQSGFSSPMYAMSRAGSHENLAMLGQIGAVAPAALSSRLQQHALNESNDNRRSGHFNSSRARSGATTPHDMPIDGEPSQSPSTELSRRTSEEEHPQASGINTPLEPEHNEFLSMAELSKVPSYSTATRTPLPRTPSYVGSLGLPDYMTAMSAPSTPAPVVISDPMAAIAETTGPVSGSPIDIAPVSRSPTAHSRASSMGFNFIAQAGSPGDAHSDRRVRILQNRAH